MSETFGRWDSPRLTDCGIDVGAELLQHKDEIMRHYGRPVFMSEISVIWVDRAGFAYETIASGVGLSRSRLRMRMREIAERVYTRPSPLHYVDFDAYHPLVFDMRGLTDE